MTRSELALVTLLVLIVAATVFVICAISVHHAQHDHSLGSVITSFEGSEP